MYMASKDVCVCVCVCVFIDRCVSTGVVSSDQTRRQLQVKRCYIFIPLLSCRALTLDLSFHCISSVYEQGISKIAYGHFLRNFMGTTRQN